MLTSRLSKLHSATDRQSGERVLIKPQKSGGYVLGASDTARPDRQITAYVARASSVVNSPGSMPGEANARVRFSADTIKFTTSALPYKVAEGDLVQLIDQTDAPIVRVSRTAPYGTDRTILFVVATSR